MRDAFVFGVIEDSPSRCASFPTQAFLAARALEDAAELERLLPQKKRSTFADVIDVVRRLGAASITDVQREMGLEVAPNGVRASLAVELERLVAEGLLVCTTRRGEVRRYYRTVDGLAAEHERAVLDALGMHCTASIPCIVRRTRIGRDAVVRVLVSLEGRGIAKRNKGCWGRT